MSILQVLSPNHFDGRNGQVPRWIILHGTAGFTTAQDVATYFANPSSQVSSNYVIGQDGTVICCVPEELAAWGNGILDDGHDVWWTTAINPNFQTISIEHVKPHTDNSDVLTDAQKQASFTLIEDICNRWGIPKRKADANGGITGHFSLQPINRARCPGPYPFDELFAYLNRNQQEETDMLQLTDPFAAAFFQDAGGKGWYCPRTKMYIGGAILTFYRQIQGAPRLPLTNEIKDVQGHPEVAYQIFESGMIVFDPNHAIDNPTGFDRVYVVKFSDPLVQRYLVLPIRNQLTELLTQAQTQLTSLQQKNTTLTQQVQSLQLQIQQLQQGTGTGPTLNDIENAATSIKASIGALNTALSDLGVE